MKKVLFFILALSSPALADIAVTPGSGKTVATLTASGREFQQVSASIDGSSNTVTANAGIGNFTVTNGANQLLVTSTGTQTVAGTVTANAGTGNFTVTNGANQLLVTSTGTQTVAGTVTANAGTGNFTVTNGANQLLVTSTGTQTVAGTVTANAGTGNFTVTNGANQLLVTSTGTQTVAGTVTANAGSGNFNVINSTVGVIGVGQFNVTGSTVGTVITNAPTVLPGIVSSTTLPSILSGGTTTTLLLDSSRRVVVSDIPFETILSTWNTSIAPATTEVILVSSAAAGTRTYLCGCIFMNNSATNTGFQISQSFSVPATNPFYPIGAPANYVPSGIRTDCGHPVFMSAIAGQLTIKPSAAATSVLMNCSYFQR